ncbi:heme ABC exporter ATP-binding protein CcmA [Rhizobium sp. 'Codium 1']|uniref:heme ABC exporter ATP-binding protein CcmA n=1 Tax=Rhizobium sp. 'Codium 1' TaxID=2940484 RepID=UPI001E2BA5EA|nr:heme ABC exporter ATP-binding protein CcmA [Rhizobium sp. 'Codium 1']MCC8933182.1 heme ABC exporter ATP-binding protein CcmA [Rhizobium sp. 'Codium 1']
MRLNAENLSARRGDDLIFVNVSFTLAEGEALVLTGRNGSGKSTLLRVLAGLLRPETGHAVCISEDDGETRPAGEFSHYLGHRNGMKRELTVAENLAFWKSFLGDLGAGQSLEVEAAASAVDLAGITHLPYGYLSAGQQRRFAMARLLVAHRPIWILDEPTAALDRRADTMFEDLVRRHRQAGGIVIAATHQPLGMEGAKSLEMLGFDGVEEEYSA